jgi:hypothetical protein
MKAISLWQPWAQLIFFEGGIKRIETRSWNTNHRGETAIHATRFRKIDPKVYEDLREAMGISKNDDACTMLNYLQHGIPGNRFGAVIGSINLVGCVPIEQLYGTEYDTPLERACGDWSAGRYGWILSEPIEFETPVPAKGSQGFWNWQEEASI